MKRLKFMGYEVDVYKEELDQDSFDIDFNGEMMVQFTKQEDGSYRPTNAMNGWGNNCFNQVCDEKVEIT